MKYCTECSAEYQDTVEKCADCGGTELVGPAEMKQRGIRLPDDMDTRRFVRAATADDPLSSEHFVSVLEAAQIPVFARSRRDGPIEPATSAMGWWEILVPEESLQKAMALIKEERGKMDASSDEAGQAAVDEEAEGEAAEKAAALPKPA